jgi:hypothetical protein
MRSPVIADRGGVFLFVLALTACFAAAARAQSPVTVAFGGEVTSVRDEMGWLGDTYTVGQRVSGRYRFYDGGFVRQGIVGDPSEVQYVFFNGPNGFGAPALDPTLAIEAGGRLVESGATYLGPNRNFRVRVNNDAAGTDPFTPAGDTYFVQSFLGFPSFFHDLTGDPVADPDGWFFPITSASLRLYDPTGVALASTDLPLAPPGLSAFATREGRIDVWDANDGTDYAGVTFRIDSLTVVPEPAGMALLGLALAAACRRGRRA